MNYNLTFNNNLNNAVIYKNRRVTYNMWTWLLFFNLNIKINEKYLHVLQVISWKTVHLLILLGAIKGYG